MKHYINTYLYTALAIFIAFNTAVLNAKVIEGINQITLPVSDQTSKTRNRAIREGLELVVIRMTGRPAVEVAETLKATNFRSSQFIQRFHYEQSTDAEINNTGNQEVKLNLVLVFDELALAELIGQMNLPIWGKNRPEMLLWIAIGEQSQRFILGADNKEALNKLVTTKSSYFNNNTFQIDAQVNSDNKDAGNDLDSDASDANNSEYLRLVGTEDDLINHLETLSKLRGLPLIFPLLDLQDELALDSTDIWGLFDQPIKSASVRYQSDIILAARVELIGESWLSEWMLINKDGTESWQFSSAQLATSLDFGLQHAIELVAAKFSVVQDNMRSESTLVSISNIQSIDDVSRLEQFLKAQASIGHFEIVSIKNDLMYIDIELVGQVESLLQSINLSRLLTKKARPNQGFPMFGQRIPTLYLQWQGQ